MSVTAMGVQDAGKNVRESGALWLGDRNEIARVATVVFPRGYGVEERAGRWKVAPEVFGAVTRWAKPQAFSLLAVVHTHLAGVPPRLSRADREYSVQVPGILALIIGNSGAEVDHRRWGWYVFDNGAYRHLTLEDLDECLIVMEDEHFVQKWQADADSVRELP
jgi:proteasome lid subunit RPN8/RPN11